MNIGIIQELLNKRKLTWEDITKIHDILNHIPNNDDLTQDIKRTLKCYLFNFFKDCSIRALKLAFARTCGYPIEDDLTDVEEELVKELEKVLRDFRQRVL